VITTLYDHGMSNEKQMLKISAVLLLLSALATLSACGKGLSSPPIYGVNHPTGSSAEIGPYYERFVSFGKTLKNRDLRSDLPMSFKTLGFTKATGGTIGVCITYPDGFKEVQFDPIFWSIATDTQKELVVLHELGHCSLHREHDNIKKVDGYPKSIMYPYILEPFNYYSNHDQYVLELFNNSDVFNDEIHNVTTASSYQSISINADGTATCEHENP
jgi:hypothetical protein